MDISGHVGYNDKLFIAGQGGDYGVGLGFTFPIISNLYFSPSINYNVPVGDLSDDEDGAQNEELFWGVNVSAYF